MILDDYSYCTMTLKDAIDRDEHFLDFLSLGTSAQTTALKNMFIAVWDIYELGGETMYFTQRMMINKFNSIKEYYQNLINAYETQLDYQDGIKSIVQFDVGDRGSVQRSGSDTYQNENQKIDLPNRSTTGEYISNKDKDNGSTTYGKREEYIDVKDHKTTTTGNVNVIEQREKYLKYLRNIYYEMVYEFKPCFAMIFG